MQVISQTIRQDTIHTMALMLHIKVKPRSGKQSCQVNKSGVLQVFLKSPPENNKANSELVLYIAKLLHIPSSQISLHQGKKESKKTLLIDSPLTLADIYKKLGVEIQHEIF